jgi:hypothetical protein
MSLGPSSDSVASPPAPTAQVAAGEPPPSPLPVLESPEAVTQTSILHGFARVGAAAPEQVLALLLRRHPDEVDLATVVGWQERLVAMSREGLVDLSWCAAPAGPLRHFDRILVRLTEAGRARAADGKDTRSWRLGIIADHAKDGSWLLEESVRQLAFSDWAKAKHVRGWLKNAAHQGLVEIRATREAHRIPVFSLGKRGRTVLEQQVPPATAHVPRLARPAEAVMAHHLHMVRAAAWMMAASPPDRVFLYLESDADLASHSKRRRRSRRGDRYPNLPDGRIYLVKQNRWVTWDIEVIGNYTPDEIRGKYAALPKHTTYTAISDAVAERVVALGLPRPEVV